MKRLAYYLCGIVFLLVGIIPLSAQTQWKDTIVVSRDGSGDYRTLTEAMEGIRAFMDYKVTVLGKNGTYKPGGKSGYPFLVAECGIHW